MNCNSPSRMKSKQECQAKDSPEQFINPPKVLTKQKKQFLEKMSLQK